MKSTRKFLPLALLVMIAGCAAPISFVSTPTEPLTQYLHLEIAPIESEVIGAINQDIMNEIMTTAIKDIIALNRFDQVAVVDSIVRLELKNPDIVNALPDSIVTAAILQTTVLEYNKGSQFMRFMFGMLAGSGNVELDLRLLDKQSTADLAQAETSAGIVGAYASEQTVVIPLAKAIAKFVEQSF